MSEQIDPQKALRSIADAAPKYAKSKAERVYLDEYRKTLKAMLMIQASVAGAKTSAEQERNAYADDLYADHLIALKAAIEEEEALRWRMVAAEAAIEIWRTISANDRRMDRGAA